MVFFNTRYEIVNDKLVIKYAFSKLIISVEDIKEISESTYYACQDNIQYSIGMQNGQPDRIIIKTIDNKSYFISLNGSHILVNKIKEIRPDIKVQGIFIKKLLN